MPFFRKKPIVVEMRQFDGTNGAELCCWAFERNERSAVSPIYENGEYVGLYVGTLEGTMRLTVGNWLVCGAENEFYPIDAAIKEKTYDDVAEPAGSLMARLLPELAERYDQRVPVVAEMLWQALNRQWIDGEDQGALLAEIREAEGPVVYSAAAERVRIRMHSEIDDNR